MRTLYIRYRNLKARYDAWKEKRIDESWELTSERRFFGDDDEDVTRIGQAVCREVLPYRAGRQE